MVRLGAHKVVEEHTTFLSPNKVRMEGLDAAISLFNLCRAVLGET